MAAYSKSDLYPRRANQYLDPPYSMPASQISARSSAIPPRMLMSRPGKLGKRFEAKAHNKKCVRYELFLAFNLCIMGSLKSSPPP